MGRDSSPSVCLDAFQRTAPYLAALARVVVDLVDGKQPATIDVKPAMLTTAVRVADDSPKIFGWLFPKGFHAPAMMELARRQAWTIKPAILDASR